MSLPAEPKPVDGVSHLNMQAVDFQKWSAESIIEAFGDYVFNLSVRLAGNREDAKDLAQDSFILILKGAGSFRGESTPVAWVSRVVINCHRNRQRWWRRLRRGRAVSMEERVGDREKGQNIGETFVDTSPGPEVAAIASQTSGKLEEALGRLEVRQRAILVMREIAGLSYAEIAHALDVPAGTVKSRLARARTALADVYAAASRRESPR